MHEPNEGRASLRCVIIGAGLSGLLIGKRLHDAGCHDFIIFEKAEELGGTWRDNVYPGIACDIAAPFYSYSFEPNPDWSTRFPKGAEILDYLKRVAVKYDLRSHIRFGRAVSEASWTGSHWRIKTAQGDDVEADILISATGVLHHPLKPEIPGLDGFDGTIFHTAQWDHSVSLDGKRVGIIGNGSTSAQVVPAIINQVGSLTLFQRTPQWIGPLFQQENTPADKERLRKSPILSRFLYRFWNYIGNENYSKVVLGEKDSAAMDQACLDNLATVTDPELRAKLTPAYSAGCKRLVFSSEFYPAIQRDHARLVTERIERVGKNGVFTTDGEFHPLDVLILATGFKTDAYMRPMTMTGLGGTTLEEIWAKGAISYRAVAQPEMPNFFTLQGPYSPIGNISLIFIAECQADYIMNCIEIIRERHVALAPKRQAVDRLLGEMREGLKNTKWVTGCQSWYFDKDGNIALYPFSGARYEREMTAAPDLDDFQILALPETAA